MASARSGSSSSVAERRDERDGSSGGTATPPPDSARILGTAVPGSIDASTGRPAAMIEYVFDGTLTRARPALERHDVDVAGREQLGQSVRVDVAGEAHVGETCARAVRASGRAAPSPLIRNVDLGHLAGGGEHQVERLRESDVAGVQHDRSVAEAELGADTA